VVDWDSDPHHSAFGIVLASLTASFISGQRQYRHHEMPTLCLISGRVRSDPQLYEPRQRAPGLGLFERGLQQVAGCRSS
jgi:hypothetical protein